ncbi:hypothetical protein GCM10011450_17830 [Advenella faeciporci]|uniref:Transposase n=1 Tax=Advenella faeciporci TaxID=797535 RepID=A0A918JNG7_9BURK|nr:transposase [Advenella faeciporci]GGW88230.1 hypothetical protein GCM10011450_17830 [Advenella faeciporci]
MDVSIYSVPVAERPRRRYSNEYKRQVVEASFQANTSVAAVAQAHQINANLPHTWRWQYRKGQFGAVDRAVSLVPVCLNNPEPPVTTTTDTGYFELHINAVRLQIHGTPDMQLLPELLKMIKAC